MTKLRVVPLVALFGVICFTQAQNDDRTIAADIVFLVDASWSIGQENFQYVREFLFRVVKAFEIGENRFRIGLVQYTEKPRAEFHLNTYFAKQDILFHIWNMSYKGGGTKTGLALEYLIKEQLTKANGSRADEGVPQIIIVLTDGRSQDDVIPASESLKSANALIFAIGVQQAVEWELKEIASAPHERFVYHLDDFAALKGIVNDLVMSLHMAAANLLSDGIIKDTTAQESADLIFLIDGSASVGSVNFQYIRDFIVNLIDNLEIGPDKIQIGVVQYSDEPSTEFYLNTYSTKTEVLDAVKRLQQRGGEEINIGAAVQFLVDNHFIQSAGSRASEGVPQAVVIIISSESSDDITQAELLLKQGSIYSFSIGGRDADNNELAQLSTDPSFTALITEFRDIDQLQQQFLPMVSAVARKEIFLEPLVQNEVPDRRRDIVFLMDGSSSVGSANFLKMREFILKVINRFQIGPNAVQVAVVQYSDGQNTEFSLNKYTEKSDITPVLKNLRPIGGRSRNTGAALDYILREQFTTSAGSRRNQNIPQFLVLITTGPSEDSVRIPAFQLKENAIITYSIGVQRADSGELNEIAFAPHLVLEVPNFQALLQKPKEVATMLSRIGPPTVITEGPTVIITEVVTQALNQRDIVFLIDGSSNVGQTYFPLLREFIRSIVEELNVARDSVRIAVVQFSNDARLAFSLDRYNTKSEVLAHVRGLRLKGGRVLNTGAALDYVRQRIFSSASGSRIEEGIPQLLVVVTAGRSNDDVRRPAEALARGRILTIAVGVSNADVEEVKRIAFSGQTAFQVDAFDGLSSIQEAVASSARSLVHGGVTEVPLALKRDVVFLVDGSAGMGQSFYQVREFLIRVVQHLEIGPDKDKVAVVRYSSDPSVEFGLDAYLTKDDVLEAIQRLPVITGRPLNTGVALDFVARDVFSASAGSRRDIGASQILVLITAGKSRDDIRPAAGRVKLAGIVPIAVGAKNADTSELQHIVHDPAFLLIMRDFQDLSGIQQDLLSKMRTVVIFEEEVVQRDVVFLIDGSENVRSAFPSIQQFISGMVDSLDIGSDRVRVGLVQYSEDPAVNFYLNSYATKEDVKRAISTIGPKGGQRANTGKALDYVKQNIFTTSAGSRVDEGVPQFLILLTASRSADDVGQAALELKKAGVAPFAIGSRDADDSELTQISLSPEYIFKVPHLRNVEIIQQSLEMPLTQLKKDQIIQITKDETRDAGKRDVVFLIDGSENVRSAFPSIQKFIVSVVNNLDIGSDKARVALVQYSEDPSVNFYLNSYTTKRDVIDVVNNLRPRGGQRANTGKALDYVKQSIFTTSAGSRVNEGVPQFLILLTASRSADDVGQAALELKEAGVAPFAIGSGDADDSELTRISLSPNYIFKVSDLQDVETLQQNLETPLKWLRKKQIIQIGTTALQEAVKRDVVFLIDGSDKVRPAFQSIQRFLSRMVDNLDIGSDKVRVGLVQYSEDPIVNFYLNSYTTEEDVKRAISTIGPKGGQRANTGKALDYVKQNIFTTSAGSRVDEGVAQFLILLTASRSADDVGQAALELKRAGVAPFAIGSGDTDDSELREISLSPNYIFKVSDLQNVERIEQSLGTPLTTLSRKQIIDIGGDVLAEAVKRDVVFLIDGSDKVQPAFQSIQRFLSRMVDNLDIGRDKVRVGLVQYSEDPVVNFYLNSYITEEDVKRAISTIGPKGGQRANTGKALDYVKQNIFTTSAGSRVDEGVPQFLILLTASKSADDVGQAALELKRAGVAPFAIGSGDADDSELREISLSPNYIFKVSDLQNVERIEQSLGTPLTTLSRKQIIVISGDVLADTVKRDVVFLIDGSDKVQPAFQSIQRFLSRMVDNLDIGRDKVRVGLVQYSEDPVVNFYLNSYTTGEDVKREIRNIRLKGGQTTNTGKALDYVKQNIFTTSAGSRADEGVAQFLILLTASRSADDVSQAALELKKAGVAPFAIGSGDADDSELTQISLSPKYIFKVSDLRNVERIEQSLGTPLTTLSRKEITDVIGEVPADTVKRDVVFLIDGSEKVRPAFQSIQRFLSRMVDNLDIGRDKVRVGLVQYSEDPVVNFYLNSYTTEEDVKRAISTIRPKGGRRVNTGKALDYVKQSIFTTSAGSRVDEGVAQFLILLTASRSADDVGQAALELKRAGVAPFAIGSGDADDSELTQISLSPKYIFKVSDLRNVERIEQSLGTPLTTLSRKEITDVIGAVPADTVKRDVVFLIDGSEKVRPAFQSIQRFLSRMVDNLDIGRDKVRVGLVQYSEDPVVNFYLNSYTTEEDVKRAISTIRPKGGRRVNTGKALDYVKQSIFTTSAGSRVDEGVAQFLILLTASRSADDVGQAALELKRAGVAPFAIGSGDADDSELTQISLSPKYIFKVSDLRNVERIEQSLGTPLTTLSRKEITDVIGAVPADTVKRDVVFLIDGSEKVRPAFQSIQRFLSRMVDNLDIGRDKVRVGLVQYSEDPVVNFYLNSYTTEEDVKRAISTIRPKGGRRVNTGKALDYVKQSIFTTSAGSRVDEGVAQFLILLTASRSADDVGQAALELKRAGVAPFAIGSGDADDSELTQISLSPKYIFKVSDLRNVERIEQSLGTPLTTLSRKEITDVIGEVPADTVKRDVVFLIDGSDKVQPAFQSIQRFLSRMVDNLDIGRDKVRVGLVQYSEDPVVNFYLNSYTTGEDVKREIRNIRLKGGQTTNTGKALDYVKQNIFTTSAGSRVDEGVAQFLILLTASRSADDVSQAALELKKAGVAPFAIGSGDADDSELTQISLSPKYIFKVSDLRNVERIEQSLGTPLTTLSRKEITDVIGEVPADTVKRDVVFLIDGSEKVRPAFQSIQRFLSRMVDNLDIGRDKVRVGLVQYSEDPVVNFYLNSYTTEEDVKRAISTIRPKGGRRVNTGKALDYVKQSIFTTSAGSRVDEGVAQFLILLTASRSADDVGQAALELKRAGVAPFAIGSGDADDSELTQISLSPKYIFKVSDLRNVERIEQSLGTPLTTLSRKEITDVIGEVPADAVKRDVVFLIDGSDKVRPAFQAIQRFLSRMVDNLDIGSDKVRVSLVQYSEDPVVNFYLNSYTTEEDVKRAISTIRPKGGRRVNTGKALDYVKQSIFTTSAGSRVDEGVAQFLILLTASRSADDVGQAALELKRAGVAPFAIGSGDADDSELTQISLSPKYIFKVSDLRNVERIEQSLGTPLTTLSRKEITDVIGEVPADAVERDVVFLIDGSDKVRPAFQSIQRFLSRMVDNLDIGSDKVQVGLVQYSEDPVVDFYLNSYATEEEVKRAISNIRPKGGRTTNTGKALDYVKQNIFTTSAGSRVDEGVAQFLILLTASRSADDVGQAALELKRAGVAPFAIGSGDADDSELTQISLSPNYIFKVSDLRNVERIEQSLGTPLTTLSRKEITDVIEEVLADAVKRDVVFLIDGSDKVRPAFQSIQRFLSRMVDNLDIGSDKVQVGLVQYSEDPVVDFYLNSYATEEEVKRAISNIRPKGGRTTNTGKALDYVKQNIFTTSAGSRVDEGVAQFLILLTASRSADDVGQAALELKRAGVAPFAIGSGDADDSELTQISLSPNYIFKVSDLQNVERIEQSLGTPLTTLSRKEITDVIEEVLAGYAKRDVVFLVDGSDNARGTFSSIKTFINKFVDNLDIERDKVRVGLLQFSEDPSIDFSLDIYETKDDVKRAVNGLRYKGGRQANIGKALNYVVKNVFTRSAGSRVDEGVPQFLILLTTSRSSDNVETAALALKKAGVGSVSIGSGNAEDRQLQMISMSPKFTFKFDQLRDSDTLKQDLQGQVKTLNREQIVQILQDAPKDVDKRDVVFVLDGSDNVRSAFPSIRSFISRVVDSLDVGIDQVRVGVVQFSNDPRTEFQLNTYTTKAEVQDGIRNLRFKGGRGIRTGVALQYAKDNLFTRAGGSRIEEGVPQFLVLLTAGKSADRVDLASVILKEAGVAPIAIGHGRADDEELRQISLSPQYVYKIVDFRNILNIQQSLLEPLTTLDSGQIRKIYESNVDVDKRDIVFVLDGSDNVRSAFPSIRSFISRVVDSLDVGIGRVRVGVVQFSNDPRTEFQLNTYTTKAEVQDAIRNLQFKGGRGIRTGVALQYAKDNLFTRAGGSRIEEGVPQFLVLLTAGKSADRVDLASAILKEAGVAPIAIGHGRADDEELRQISLSSQYVYKIVDFRNILNIQQSLLEPLTTLDSGQIRKIYESNVDANKKDIVFLIDGSNNVDANDFPHIRDFVLNIINSLDIGPNKVRVGLAQYSNNAKTEFLLRQFTNLNALQNAIRRIRPKGGSPLNVGTGLEFVLRNHFTRQAGSRQNEGALQYLILINGGKSSDRFQRYLGNLRNSNINVFAVGAKNVDESELRQMVTVDYGTYVLTKFQDLKRVQDLLKVRLQMQDPKVFVTPEPPTAVLPQKKADIVFLLDSSINIGRSNFPRLTEFIYSIVDAIYVDDGSIQVGVVQYNSDAVNEFFLNSFRTRQDVLKAIENIQFRGGRILNTGAALRFAKNTQFVKSAGSRIEEGVPQIIFLLIGGKSNDDAIAAAKELKNSGLKIITVGMQRALEEEINQIVSEPAVAFRVSDLSTLSELTEQVLLATTDVIDGQLCPVSVDAKECDIDVLMGFDVSSANAFEQEPGFRSKVGDILYRISQLKPISCTGTKQPSVRIALVTLRGDGKIDTTDLTAYRSELITDFIRIAASGPTLLGTRTLNAYSNVFQSDSSGKVKAIIHFTDGIDEDFSILKRYSDTLRKEAKVHSLILVSLERMSGSEDLSLLEFGRGFRYRRHLSINQHDLEYELAEELDNIAERVCCGVSCKCAGPPGDRGFQGSRGRKGSPGTEGIPGYPGEEGGTGDRGPAGMNGTQGFQGCEGHRGFKGAHGYPGEKGQGGELGLDGIDGEQGLKGGIGSPGERGNPGALGTKGAKGSKGERGDIGYRGDPGEPGRNNNQRGLKGQRGDLGLVGETGDDGRPGEPGQNGRKGVQGRRGSAGRRGSKGNPGASGPPGMAGFRGVQGDPGSSGTPGQKGIPGIRGPRGPAGAPAPSGTRGKIGLNGRKGEPGNPGEKGEIGPTGPRGEMGEDGANRMGNPGVKGRKGERGSVGPLGVKGNLGTEGEPGKGGMKGNRGRRGYPGPVGEGGSKGEIGYPGPKGAKGPQGRFVEPCSLVRQIRETCPSCQGAVECPAYPTELAFVIDTSTTANQLNGNKNAILNIIENLTIVDSNCPKGARVAILTYNSDIVTEIRFSSARNKRDLLDQVKNLQFVPSRKASSIADAMNFVARNTFKRVRSGFLLRKVALFFSDGQSKPRELNAALTKLADNNIISVYLSPREDNVLKRALQRSAGVKEFFVFRNDIETLRKVMTCYVCLDFCEVDPICESSRTRRSVTPANVDLDLAFIIDSSATINPNQFIEIKRYISFLTEQLEISKEPATSSHKARVALVQHALYKSQTNNSLNRVKTEFTLTDYQSSQDMREYILNKMTQLEGGTATAHAVEWTITNIFEKAPHPRPLKLIVLMTTGDIPKAEKEQLMAVITDAKCKGFFIVIFDIFSKPNEQDLINLASEPQDVYFKPISKISALHSENLLRFAQQLPEYVSAENAFHLSPELKKQCGSFQSDQPVFINAHQQVTTDVPLSADKLKELKLSASSVTEDTIVLQFSQTEAQRVDNYEVTVVDMSQDVLVLKQNFSDPEIVVKDLENGQQYKIIVLGFSQSEAKSIYNGVFTTKKPLAKEAEVTLEPLEDPEIDRCMLDFDAGSQCSEYSAKWFFDRKNNICAQFWYGGCDGNGNRFDTEAECNAECVKSIPEASVSEPKPEGILASKSKDICQLPRNEGTCRNFSLKWYYDVKTETCTRFWYGGCNGNGNRFNTLDECSKTCIQGRVQTRMITTMGT